MEREKKREFATYFKLHLDRQLKSRAKRAAVAQKGLYVFIGGQSPDMPYLKVPKASYISTWQAVASELSARITEQIGDTEDYFNLLLPRIERETYTRLAEQALALSELDRQFIKQQGRAMTIREKELYHNALSKQTVTAAKIDAGKLRKIWLDSVIKKIRQAQNDNPHYLQNAWANVVGTNAAMETVLEKVDPLRGVAFCRSTSSVRRYELHRQNAILAAKLSRLLKIPIKKIVFR